MRGYCCNCRGYVDCKAIKGNEYYSGEQYSHVRLAQCEKCGNVSTYYDNEDIVIPNWYIKKIRHNIHVLMSPYWKNNKIKNKFYVHMSQKLGYNFHCGEIMDENEADKAYHIAKEFVNNIKEA